ncbi:hypothetical protein [Stackebrandtia nassauensis]|uniref:Uncharacterized protein n=1 Tax=Stackebrandtia nassauensis (strain DSM 44728 / CIP 108903 / NRRL B-16338 / NBRC 102104 / LLR-40K-21) TaxID=446470 RepID=D3Q1K4_STANL|nr:hypothetical protein [Stackebrandtia nassauensis]ADD39852.1 hypothetical protein Snas_0131 [Stackebrandtia nassauensis DSM 44728]
MASAGRESRGHDRVASLRWSSVATFAARGFVIAGMAGVAWMLGTTTAQAAPEGQTSPDSLVPATSSVFDDAVSTSEQAARSIRSNQLGSGGSSSIDVAESLVSELSEEAGGTLTDAGHNGRGSHHEDKPSGTGTSGTRQNEGADSVHGLVRDLTRPSSLEETVSETTDPLAELTDEVETPVSKMTRAMVTPISDGVDKADESVSGLLDEATDPVSDRDVASVLAPLADSASLTKLIGTGDNGNRQSIHNTLRSADADAGFKAPNTSGNSAVSGTEATENGTSSDTGSALSGAKGGASAPAQLPLSPRPHIPGVFSGGSTTGNGIATDRGATDAGAACIGYAGQVQTAQVSRVRPNMSTMGRPSELIADPAVSPD